MTKLDYEKIQRKKPLPYEGKPKAPRGPTSSQTKLIARLRREQGVRKGPMPGTAAAASDEISKLRGKHSTPVIDDALRGERLSVRRQTTLEKNIEESVKRRLGKSAAQPRSTDDQQGRRPSTP